jgi:hypothetical protein
VEIKGIRMEINNLLKNRNISTPLVKPSPDIFMFQTPKTQPQSPPEARLRLPSLSLNEESDV